VKSNNQFTKEALRYKINDIYSIPDNKIQLDKQLKDKINKKKPTDVYLIPKGNKDIFKKNKVNLIKSKKVSITSRNPSINYREGNKSLPYGFRLGRLGNNLLKKDRLSKPLRFSILKNARFRYKDYKKLRIHLKKKKLI
jgi:hypothetical protein